MSESQSISVSVIIPVYNDSARLRLCLEALENQTFPSNTYEVIVVDNRSTEPVEPVVAAFPHARYAYEEQQSSYAARNRGLQVARGSVLAFTDADCIPNPDWIEQGVNLLQSADNIGLIGGRVELFPEKPDAPNWAEAYDLVSAFPQKRHVEESNFAATANVFTTRAVMDVVGVFNEKRISGGDRVWGRRVAAAGYRLIYADRVVVRHPARNTFSELRKRARRLIRGVYDDRKERKLKPSAFIIRVFARFFLNYLPPTRAWRLFSRPELPNLGQRTKAFLVAVYIHYYRAWCFSELAFQHLRNVAIRPRQE